MSKIPKIIHQTWKSKDIPDKYKDFVNSWKNLHPDWEYRLYDDDDCIHFVQAHYPQFLNAYLKLPTPVMKADMFRYLAVHQFGGVYADLDVKAFKSFNSLLTGNYDMIIGLEIDFNYTKSAKFAPVYKNFYSKWGIDKQYAQYCFMATPKNPILLKIVNSIVKDIDKIFHSNTQVNTIVKTGPGIFTKIIEKNKNSRLKILDLKLFGGIRNIILHYFFGVNKPHKESYVQHYELASWKNKDDIIYTLLSCVVLALLITIFIFFSYGIAYFNKCKKAKSKKCMTVLTYCKVKKILMILSSILLVLIFGILINFAVQDHGYWPF